MKNFYFSGSEILLPNVENMTAWSVIACDQFTSEQDYWQKLEQFVGQNKSTLNLILPEIYLNDKMEERIKKINDNMQCYLDEGVFKTLKDGFVLTVRKTKYKERRIGLIGKLDLEYYDFKKGSKTPIRATEGTIEERIPPRLKIRENAPLEFPHIMVLIDDEKKEIIEGLYEKRDSLKRVYSFDLNMDGGSVEGYFVKDTKKVIKKLSKLANEKRLSSKYNSTDKLVFAVGDGNHSLATAKAHWEKIKATLTEKEIKNHPARYALVEIVNIYDDGIYFKPIHRFVITDDRKNFIEGLKKIDCGLVKIFGDTLESLNGNVTLPDGIKAVDKYIKEYLEVHGGTVDYVHGEENIKKLVEGNSNSVGILFNEMEKELLFKYVINNGSLPRKTFSMGEGIEKRYYLEGRRIK